MRIKRELTMRARLILHGTFLVIGTASVLVGQVLPILARSFSLNDLQLGYVFPTQFAGSITGTLISSRFARRNDHASAAVIGCLFMAFGIMLISAGRFDACLLGFLLNGLGIGLALPSINLVILEMDHVHTASALNILNFCWGVGAIICKPFVDTLTKGVHIRPVSVILSGTFLLLGTAIFFAVPTRQGKAARGSEAFEMKDEDTGVWTSPIAWTVALFNFVHVGFEGGMGGWLSTYSERLENRPVLEILSPTFLYFLFFVLGRGIAPVFFRYMNENRVLLCSLIVLLAGTGVTLMAQDLVMLSIGASVAGLGTSTIFPTNLSRFSKIFGAAASRRATPLFVSGTLGAASVTWLIGFFSSQAGDLKVGMYVLLAVVLLLIIIQLILSARVPVSKPKSH